ncbi:MAG: APC family permease [Myxococcaceae bacterium]
MLLRVTDRQNGPELHRALGPAAIVAYAVGDILGAGIYALVGRVAGQAGGGAWASFLVSAFIAGLTGLTYAELVSRHPVAAGAAAYTHRAFGAPLPAFLVGFLVLASGITSAAAVSHAFVGYLDSFIHAPDMLASIGMLVLLALLSFRGIHESSRVNIALTLIELSGLLFVLGVGFTFAFGRPGPIEPANNLTAVELGGVVGGATIAFFAYIGFEDAVNVVEEVRDASRNLPRAILVAIAFTTVIYLGVTVAALLTVPVERLATSDAPLLEVLEAAGISAPQEAFSVVAMIAITNTGLLNLIMGSRLLFGMAREGLLPRALTYVHPRRRTPALAILVVLVLAVLLAVSGGTQVLAQTTSFLLLLVFVAVHLALIVLKRRGPPPEGGIRVPRLIPWVGALSCVGLMFRYPAEVYARAGIVLATGILLYAAVKVRRSD